MKHLVQLLSILPRRVLVKPDSFGNKVEVAVKGIVFNEGRALVIRRCPDDNFAAGEYDLPGGRISFSEDPKDALIREIGEETGLTVKLICPLKTWSFMKGKHNQVVGITYLAKSDSKEVTLSGEHSDYAWISNTQVKYYDLPDWLKNELGLGFRWYNLIKRLIIGNGD